MRYNKEKICQPRMRNVIYLNSVVNVNELIRFLSPIATHLSRLTAIGTGKQNFDVLSQIPYSILRTPFDIHKANRHPLIHKSLLLVESERHWREYSVCGGEMEYGLMGG